MSSLIAESIGIDELVGSVLIGASMVLTTHSISRMVFLRRTASKLHLFPIINVAQLLNQIFVFMLVTAAIGTITFEVALWLNVFNNVAYFITKPTVMYLAYLRCSAVLPALKKGAWVHYVLIAIRAIELLAIVVINVATNIMCEGSLAKGTRCESFQIAWTVRDAGAPLFRFYVIACEGFFYYKLFGTLRGMANGKNAKVLRYRRLQTSLFTVDLIIMIYMSIYRIIGIWDKDLPTYVYLELFSSTLTIFNLTEFGLNIRSLFGAASDGQPISSSYKNSSADKVEMRSIDGSHRNSEGPNGHGFGGNDDNNMNNGGNLYYQSSSIAEEGRATPSYNRHNSSSSRRPLTSSSNSPLTAYPGPNGSNGSAVSYSDIDLSPSEVHRDFSPFPVVDSPPTNSSSSFYRPPFNFGRNGTATTTSSNDASALASTNNAGAARSRSLDEPWRLTIAELIAGREQFNNTPGGPPSHLIDPYSTLSMPTSSPTSTTPQQQQGDHYIIDPASFQHQAQMAYSNGRGNGALKTDASHTQNLSASPRLPSAAPSPRLITSTVAFAGENGRSSGDYNNNPLSRPNRALVIPDRSADRRQS